LNVVQYGISYRFRTTPFGPSEPPSNPAEVLLERRLYFENNRAALAFLRSFSTNPFAVRGFQTLLSGLGFHHRFDEPRDEWMDRLALSLVTGRVSVIEIVPKSTGSESSERPAERMPTAPPPRRKQPEPPVEPVEPSTFAADSDEEAQVQTLVDAARSGTPFCEACARAAAAAQASKNANNAQHAV
jgi:hypothetical protein